MWVLKATRSLSSQGGGCAFVVSMNAAVGSMSSASSGDVPTHHRVEVHRRKELFS